MLLLALLLLSVAGFAVTRGVRVRDDVVNTVVLSKRVAPGGRAEISFRTTVSDARADVLITDTSDRQVRALQLGQSLQSGPHVFTWDGTRDDGSPATPGAYGIRVILGDHGRDIKPPGRIELGSEAG